MKKMYLPQGTTKEASQEQPRNTMEGTHDMHYKIWQNLWDKEEKNHALFFETNNDSEVRG